MTKSPGPQTPFGDPRDGLNRQRILNLLKKEGIQAIQAARLGTATPRPWPGSIPVSTGVDPLYVCQDPLPPLERDGVVKVALAHGTESGHDPNRPVHDHP